MERYLRVNLLGPGHRLVKKRIYRAAVSQKLRNTPLRDWVTAFFFCVLSHYCFPFYSARYFKIYWTLIELFYLQYLFCAHTDAVSAALLAPPAQLRHCSWYISRWTYILLPMLTVLLLYQGCRFTHTCAVNMSETREKIVDRRGVCSHTIGFYFW